MQLQPVIGYHVTTKQALRRIRWEGLKGSKWPKSIEELEKSCSNPFRLYRRGAVFAFPTLEEAEKNRYEWGEETVILRVEGRGIRFRHYMEGEQIVIRADTARWEVVG